MNDKPDDVMFESLEKLVETFTVNLGRELVLFLRYTIANNKTLKVTLEQLNGETYKEVITNVIEDKVGDIVGDTIVDIEKVIEKSFTENELSSIIERPIDNLN